MRVMSRIVFDCLQEIVIVLTINQKITDQHQPHITSFPSHDHTPIHPPPGLHYKYVGSRDCLVCVN